MNGFTWFDVGPFRVLVTCFNNESDLSLLACEYLMRRFRESVGTEAATVGEFRAWVNGLVGGPELLADFDRGQLVHFELAQVTPLNAEQELRCVTHILSNQRKEQRPSKNQGAGKCPSCGK